MLSLSFFSSSLVEFSSSLSSIPGGRNIAGWLEELLVTWEVGGCEGSGYIGLMVGGKTGHMDCSVCSFFLRQYSSTSGIKKSLPRSRYRVDQ